MIMVQSSATIKSAFFITFNGNCREALAWYQACFGGTIQLNTFTEPIEGCIELPVVNGTLVSEKLLLHGSDLVHDEGRRIGNHLALYIHCGSHKERITFLKKLVADKQDDALKNAAGQKLIEVTDRFDVVWVFGI